MYDSPNQYFPVTSVWNSFGHPGQKTKREFPSVCNVQQRWVPSRWWHSYVIEQKLQHVISFIPRALRKSQNRHFYCSGWGCHEEIQKKPKWQLWGPLTFLPRILQRWMSGTGKCHLLTYMSIPLGPRWPVYLIPEKYIFKWSLPTYIISEYK